MDGERKRRKYYSDDFKAEAVRLVKSGERTRAEASRNLGVSLSAISKWCNEADEGCGSEAGLAKDLATEVKRLEAENRRLKLEQEILKKAATYFAKNLA